MQKGACIFHLILVGIPSILILSVKNKGVGGWGGVAWPTKSVKRDKNIVVLNLHSKWISFQTFFYFELFICSLHVRRPKFFGDFPSRTPTRSPPWTCYQTCSTSRPPPALYNIQKLNLCSKTDISETAWINTWYIHGVYIYINLYIFMYVYIYIY